MEEKYAKDLLEKLKKNYNQIAEDFANSRKKPWEEAKFLLKNFVFPEERILDLGCAQGHYYQFFREKKAEYFGVDFSENLIGIAKKNYPEAKFFLAEAMNLPFENNFFDKVFAIALFHHIPSENFRQKTLKEIKRVLKPGGFLILTVWNLWQKWKTKKIIFKFIILKILGKSKLDFKDILMDFKGIKDCYFHCFDKKELQKMIKKANFKLIQIGEFFVGKNSNFYAIAKNNPSKKLFKELSSFRSQAPY